MAKKTLHKKQQTLLTLKSFAPPPFFSSTCPQRKPVNGNCDSLLAKEIRREDLFNRTLHTTWKIHCKYQTLSPKKSLKFQKHHWANTKQEPLSLRCFLISATPFFLEGSLVYHFNHNPQFHCISTVLHCTTAFHRPFSSSRKVKTPSRPLSSGRAWLSTHGRGARGGW